MDKRDHLLAPGQVLILPPGKRHSQGNPFSEPVVAIETYRPGKRIHEFCQAFFAHGALGLTDEIVSAREPVGTLTNRASEKADAAAQGAQEAN